MKEFLKRWWQGTYVPPPPNEPHSGVFFVMPGTYKLHWTAKAAHAVLGFLRQYWQWSIGVCIAVFFGFYKH